MRRVVDKFGGKPLGYIVLEGVVFGRVYHRGLGSRRYRITAWTAGGHSWVDHGTPSAIHEMASLITALASIKLSEQPRTTLNVGRIEGGLSVNSIASEATIELDLRSEDGSQLNKLVQKVDKLVRKSSKNGVEFTSEIIGDRETGDISENHPLVRLAVDVLEKQGRKAELNIGSTDANVPLSRGYPAICIGLTNGGGTHTEKEFILTDGLSEGLAQLVEVVRGAFEVL
jgi:acetylornithine deacetylase/succinyl-diaminopimelate desuccinylase-like protein